VHGPARVCASVRSRMIMLRSSLTSLSLMYGELTFCSSYKVPRRRSIGYCNDDSRLGRRGDGHCALATCDERRFAGSFTNLYGRYHAGDKWANP
jgi:hypothetical protein